MQVKLLFLSMAFLVLLFACQEVESPPPQQTETMSAHKVVVKEVLQANSYTYLRVAEENSEHWIAVAKSQIQKGEILYYENALRMTNFESKDLNKVFDTVYFVESISSEPVLSTNGQSGHPAKSGRPALEKQEVSVQPIKSGISLAELFANKDSYANDTIKVKGQVTKVNSGIMGKNWVHLQDGTSHAGEYDLTVTTDEVVNLGDVVIFEGTIALNKDFGAGYFYEIIMEGAKRQK